MSKGKKYSAASKLVGVDKLFTPNAALDLLKNMDCANFDETVEVHFNLGIDPKYPDQQLRGNLSLPNGTGKDVKVLAILKQEKVDSAINAGADFAGAEEIIEKIASGWIDFDVVLATPDMMSKIGKVGRILGTKGLMPNPKSGTVTPQIENAIQEFKSGKIEYRNDKNGNLHLILGKKSFDTHKLFENFLEAYDTVLKIKPAKAKGIYIKSLSLCTTMSPGVPVESLKVKWSEN
jgi:large subunit ribosomal protein L1